MYEYFFYLKSLVIPPGDGSNEISKRLTKEMRTVTPPKRSGDAYSPMKIVNYLKLKIDLLKD